MSSIYGISVTLGVRDTLADSQRLTLLTALQEQTTRMRNLVEQLLDLSRLDLAAIHISPELLRLRPKIEELVRPLADARPNAVRIAVPSDLEVVVDPAALDRMLTNLIANSLRHGKPPVTITADGQDRHLRLAVEDVAQAFRLSSSLASSIGSHAARSPVTEATARALVSRSPRRTLELTEERSSTSRRCRTEARFEVVIPLRGYGDRAAPARTVQDRGASSPARLS